MNAVERVLHYAELPGEGDFSMPNDPPSTCPMKGKITFSNVENGISRRVAIAVERCQL